MKKLAFKVRLHGMEGSSVAALSAPFSVEKIFGTKARVPVRGTINGFPFRSSLSPMAGCHRMVVNKTIREGAGVKAGDTVSVVMQRDEEERTIEIPPALKKAMAGNRKAQSKWKTLSYTHQKEMTISILNAKQEKTRQRRLAKLMEVLNSEKKWMG